MTPEEIAKKWPGKVSDKGTPPALWHMLDVGAVAQCLIDRRPIFGKGALDKATCFLIALHDLGKISENFRKMLLGCEPSGRRHWQHSYRLLQEHDALLSELLGGEDEVRDIFYDHVHCKTLLRKT